MLVEGVSNLQPTDKCEGGNFLPTVRYFSKLIQEEIKVGHEVVFLSHSDREDVVVISLSYLTGGVLGEKHFSHLGKVME